MADTGCQSCLASFSMIQRLGIKKSDLMPVTLKMHAANSKDINILGAVILCFSGKDASGKLVETRQMTYVTNNSDKVFLSYKACINLGLITEAFPMVGEFANTSEVHDTPCISTAIEVALCGCPR